MHSKVVYSNVYVIQDKSMYPKMELIILNVQYCRMVMGYDWLAVSDMKRIALKR